MLRSQVPEVLQVQTELTLSKPRDEYHASQYPEVKDRQTIFSDRPDDVAMLYVETVLMVFGDEVGGMLTTSEVAAKLKIGREKALSSCSVLESWGFLANLGVGKDGRYIFCRTTKPSWDLDYARHTSWLRCMQARSRRVREEA